MTTTLALFLYVEHTWAVRSGLGSEWAMTAARSSTVLSRKLSIIADKSIVSAPRSYIRRVASTVVALRYVYVYTPAPSLLYSYLMSPILTQLRNINAKSDMIIHTIT